MKRALLSLLLVVGSACSPTTVETESSSSGSMGGFGGFGSNTLGNNGSGSTTSHSIGGSSAGTNGASGSNAVSSASNATTASSGNTGSPGRSSGSGTTAASGSTSGANLAATTASSSSGGPCIATGEFSGIADGSLCCTGIVDSAGYCATTATSGTVGTSGSGTIGTTTGGTGTTTGTTCPQNMPDLATGETSTVAGPCSPTGDPCPTGFSCIDGRCTLHGSSGQLQMTMSWDDPEDLDLHVLEPQASQPGGYCEIYYGNVGNREYPDGGLENPSGYSGYGCTPIGWLDRDSNPACVLDNVDVENVIYPPNATPPSGTYTVLGDYYEACDQDNPVYYAIQVRREGAVYKYCREFTPNDSDGSGPCTMWKTDGGSSDDSNGNSGTTCTMVSTFTLP